MTLCTLFASKNTQAFCHKARDFTYLLAWVWPVMKSTCLLIGRIVTEGLSLDGNQSRLAHRHTHTHATVHAWWITLMEYTIWSSSLKAIWWMDLKLFGVRVRRSDWDPIHNKDCCQVQGLNYTRLLAKQATALYTSSRPPFCHLS